MDFSQLSNLNPWIIVILIILILGYLFWRSRDKFSSIKSTIINVYTRDLTAEARAGRFEPVIGREQEVERLFHILARKTKNNPLLIGEPGVGKTAIVEGLVQRLIANDVPDNLKDKRVLALDLVGLISGTKYRGEFEGRVKQILTEIMKEKRKIILFIDEVHMIVQAKGTEGALNVSDILKPALSRGDLQTIGATTHKDYEQFIKPDDALDRRFQPVSVKEPNLTDALRVIQGIKGIYEAYHKVRYVDEALEAAVKLSAKYIKDRYLPDKAIDLIDEAGAKVGIEEGHEARHAAGLLYAAGCKHAKQIHEHEGKIPLVSAGDIREIVTEWTGQRIKAN